jgi:hypothetical protein
MNDLDININYSNVNLKRNKNMYSNKSDISKEEKDYLIEKNFQFFLEYSKVFKSNELLKYKLQELIKEKNKLKMIINKLEKTKSIKINNLYTKRKVF